LIVQALEEGVRTGFKVRSERWCAEAKKFVYKNGKPDHMAGSHDDLLMAMGMCLYVANTAFKKLLATEKATRAMLESWKVNNVSTVANPLNERLKEVMSTRPEPNKVYSYDEFQMKHGNSNNLQNTKDFSWLFGTFKKRQVINGK
jgi:hypothetical protein